MVIKGHSYKDPIATNATSHGRWKKDGRLTISLIATIF